MSIEFAGIDSSVIASVVEKAGGDMDKCRAALKANAAKLSTSSATE